MRSLIPALLGGLASLFVLTNSGVAFCQEKTATEQAPVAKQVRPLPDTAALPQAAAQPTEPSPTLSDNVDSTALTSTPEDNTGLEAASASAPIDCDTTLKLDGAGSDPKREDDVAFREVWRPHLQHVVTCLQQGSAQGACVSVQGQFDEQTFPAATAQIVGGQRAAQIDRADSRARIVLTELHAMGAPGDQLRSLPPPTEPSYRGVELTLKSNCSGDSTPPDTERSTAAASPDAIVQALEDAGYVSSAPPAEEEAPPPPSLKKLWIGGAATGGVSLVSPEDIWYGSARAAVGYQHNWYAHLSLGLALGTTPEHRGGFNWSVAGGYVPLDWLRFGVTGGHRIMSSSIGKAWIEQMWSLGIEVSERLIRKEQFTMWFSQSFLPLSYRKQRAAYDGEQLVDVDDHTDYAPSLGISLTLQAHLL